MRTNGPVPPPEKAIANVAALGTTVPSGAKARVESIGTQPAPLRTRTGRMFRTRRICPSGRAETTSVAVVASGTSTAWPQARAAACAAATPETWVAQGGFTAAWDPAAPDPAVTTTRHSAVVTSRACHRRGRSSRFMYAHPHYRAAAVFRGT